MTVIKASPKNPGETAPVSVCELEDVRTHVDSTAER